MAYSTPFSSLLISSLKFTPLSPLPSNSFMSEFSSLMSTQKKLVKCKTCLIYFSFQVSYLPICTCSPMLQNILNYFFRVVIVIVIMLSLILLTLLWPESDLSSKYHYSQEILCGYSSLSLVQKFSLIISQECKLGSHRI